MHKQKIKELIIYYFSATLIITIILQTILYSALVIRNNKAVSSVFDSVAQNTASQIEALNEDVADLSLLISSNKNVQEFLYTNTHRELIKNTIEIQAFLSGYLERNKNILYLGLVKHNKPSVSVEKESFYAKVLEIIDEFDGKLTGSRPLYTSYLAQDGRTIFYCVTPVFPMRIDYYSTSHERNYILCLYEMNTINYSQYAFIQNNIISLLITDEDNRVIFSSEPSRHGQVLSENKETSNMFSKTIFIPSTKWNATIFSSSVDLKNFSDFSLLFILFMLTINIVILIIMLKLLNGVILRRISIISDAVIKIPYNNLDYRISYPYNDEFIEITHIINQSLDKIYAMNEEKTESMKKLFQAELFQKEIQLVYLSGQVSPHFLYNSMAHIQALALQNRSQEIAELTVGMAKVFRYYSNNRPFSTVKQDLDCAVEYFGIINVRRYAPLEIECMIDENLHDIPCLKMIYQPIIENILKHAYRYNESGTVKISSIPDEDNVIIQIRDTGKGFSKETLDALNAKLNDNGVNGVPNGVHTGILNVDLRLKLYYGNDAGVFIKSLPGEPAIIEIKFNKNLPHGS